MSFQSHQKIQLKAQPFEKLAKHLEVSDTITHKNQLNLYLEAPKIKAKNNTRKKETPLTTTPL